MLGYGISKGVQKVSIPSRVVGGRGITGVFVSLCLFGLGLGRVSAHIAASTYMIANPLCTLVS